MLNDEFGHPLSQIRYALIALAIKGCRAKKVIITLDRHSIELETGHNEGALPSEAVKKNDIEYRQTLINGCRVFWKDERDDHAS